MTEPSDAIPAPDLERRPAADEGGRPDGRAAGRSWTGQLRTGLVAVLAAVPLALAGFALVAAVLPIGAGTIGFVVVFEQQLLLLTLAVCVPIALISRIRPLLLSVVVASLAFGGLFGSEWISLPGSAASRSDLSVLTWNLEYGTRTPDEAVAQLRDVTSDVVALEELEPRVSAAIEADSTLTARYPYRLMSPRPWAWGIGIMSRYPLSDTDSIYPPSCAEALVATPRGPVRIIAGHPRHAAVHAVLRFIPVYDPGPRDERIATIREKIDRSLAAGERLVVVGDFNTTPTEPEYAVLAKGLRDTHVEVGTGPGWTWRPGHLTFLPMGYLRIDVQLSGGAIRPSSTDVVCSTQGDHCQLFGTYQID